MDDLRQQRAPVAQRLDEWVDLDPHALQYHMEQWDTPKRSTVAFEQFVRTQLSESRNVIDMGAGAGASTAFLAAQHPATQFTGFDYSRELVAIGSRLVAKRKVSNVRFLQGDWFRFSPPESYDGVVSLQTLSWLPEHEAAMRVLFSTVKPRWIALTSLFHEGDISCRIEVSEHKRNRNTFYNIYSIPAFRRLCESAGYRLQDFRPFEIDIDLPRPQDPDTMGTYTAKVVDGSGAQRRIQISGPVLMSWYMILVTRCDR